MTDQSVGFVGLGNLGLPMVTNLVQHSWRVVVHDSVPARVGRALDAGAVGADDLLSIADCDYVCLAVPDDAAVSQVLGLEGFLDRLRPDAMVIVHSTVLPLTAISLAQECARRHIGFLDAPVSGGADRARSGDLTVMVGATPADLDRGRKVLDDQASQIVHVGPPGAGAAVKLANQLMLFSALAGAYEAMAVAKAYGVDEALVLEAVGSGTGASWSTSHWGFYDQLSAEYDDAGVPAEHRPWSKDLLEVVRAAADKGLTAPVAGLVSAVLPAAVTAHAHKSSQTSTGEGEK